MSDRNDNPEQPVDPILDALLRRTLGRGGLTSEQRRRHLEELDLEPGERAVGIELLAGMEPSVSGTPRSISFDSSAPRAGGRPRRDTLEMAAVLVAVVLAAGFLMTLLWDGSGDPASQPVATPEPFATPAPFVATSTPPPVSFADAPERLYVVSHVLTQTVDVVLTSGRVTALDPETGQQAWSLYMGRMVDALLSHDGATLYIASADGDGGPSHVIAVDAITGSELWRAEIADRVWWSHGYGPSGLALSRDGGRLHVLSCTPVDAQSCDPSRDLRLVVFDTGDGERVEMLEFPGCLGTPHLSPDGGTLYLICDGRAGSRIIDLTTGESETVLLGYPRVGTTVSPDGHKLYIVSYADGVYETAVIGMDSREMEVQRASVALVGSQPERFLDLVTVSPDGSLLFIGVLSSSDGAAPIAKDIFVMDAGTLQSVGRMTANPTITAPTLAPAADNRSVFAAHRVVEHDPGIWARSTILRFGLQREPQTIAVLEHHEVLRLMIWTGLYVDLNAPGSMDGASREVEPTPKSAVSDAQIPTSQAEACPTSATPG